MYSLELQTWRNLSVPVKLFQNASSFSSSFSSASVVAGVIPQDVRKGKSFTVSYIVDSDSQGVAKKLGESTSRKLRSEGKGNPDPVVNLFKSYGFTDSQIKSIIKGYPPLLREDAEKSLGPKLNFLKSRGASRYELTEILSTVPKILRMKEENTISNYYDFVKEIIEADKSYTYVKLLPSLPEGRKQENKFRNLLVLRELGVSQKNLFSLLFSNRQLVCGKEKFEESVKKGIDMGFDPTTSKFVHALDVVYSFTDKAREGKVNAYRRLGFAVDDVWAMFKKHPFCLALSEKRILNSFETFLRLGISRDEVMVMVKRSPPCLDISADLAKKKIEFLVKKMNWPLNVVVLRPHVLSYSMEKRMVPRCNVIRALISKGLLGYGFELPPISCVLECTDEAFLKRYVRKHDDKELVADLMAILKKDRVS